jgi:hypothetical protein
VSLSFYEELCSVIGRDAAIQLCAKYGGQILYLPQVNGYQGPLTELQKVRHLFLGGDSPELIARRLNLRLETVVDLLEVEFTSGAHLRVSKYAK